MSATVNLLLLLSAMLSALTGVVTGTRADAPRQVAAASVVAVAEAVVETTARAGLRPIAALPTLVAVSALAPLAPIVVTGFPQPYASRRRE